MGNIAGLRLAGCGRLPSPEVPKNDCGMRSRSQFTLVSAAWPLELRPYINVYRSGKLFRAE